MPEQAVVEPIPSPPERPEEHTADRASDRAGDEALVAGELLVEEVSIDGMCGVY